MQSSTTAEFWSCYRALPEDVREKARQSYRLWRADVRHPSLHFKRVHQTEPIFSVRVGRRYRAVGTLLEQDHILWYWIGTHGEYDKIIR